MIQRHGGTWKTTTVNFRMLAARLGVLDDYLDHISRNRHERANLARLPRQVQDSAACDS